MISDDDYDRLVREPDPDIGPRLISLIMAHTWGNRLPPRPGDPDYESEVA